MPGTNVWSMVFVIGVFAVAIGMASALINMWRRYVTHVKVALEKKVVTPSWVGPALTTLMDVGVLALAATLGWNAMVNVTTSRSDYQSPSEVQEQKKVLESQLPSNEQLDAARTEQKQRAQVKPHKEALDSFDESMAKEAEKIKQRNK